MSVDAVYAEANDSSLSKERIDLLRNKVSTKDLEKLNFKSDALGIQQTFFHFGLLCASGYLIFLTRNNIFALILHAFFISFVFMPLHECVHETVFQTLSWNRALGLICGLITARPPIHYKYYHYAHHKYTGDKDKDPELEGSLLDPSLNSLSGYFFYLSGIPFWISRASTLFRHAISGEGAVYEFYIRSSKSKTEVVNEARMFLGIYAFLVFSSLSLGKFNVLWFYWILPSLLGQPFLRFYLIAEHNGCISGTDMMSNTRTTITHTFYRLLAWNMPYHAEHHAWPYIPFHQIPKLHQLVKRFTVDKNGCNPSGKNGYLQINAALFNKFK